MSNNKYIEYSNLSESENYIDHPLIKKKSIDHRLYQTNIVNSSRGKNSMVILPTSLGKTIISALLSADVLYNFKTMRVLVMAPTRPLVLQHMFSFSSVLKILNNQKIFVTGQIPPSTRKLIWDNKNIRLIFSTPEIIRNDLFESRLSLDDFGLVVFDEAHRAVKDYAYTYIAKKYLEQSLNPVILAMTASPGSDGIRIDQICEHLSIEHIEYRNEEDSDVKPYVNPIDLSWELIDLSCDYKNIVHLFREILKEKLRWLVYRGLIQKKNPEYIFKSDLLELGKVLQRNLQFSVTEEKGQLYSALLNQSSALSLMYCIELIESQGPYSLENFIKRMESSEGKAHSILLKDPRMDEIKKKLVNISDHPKIKYIIDLLDQNKFVSNIKDSNNTNLSLDSNSKILIFTHYRDTATHIVDVLKQRKIRSCRFVGQSSKNNDIGMKQDEQSNVLDSFRRGEFNILIATSIAEEGLDIPEVDLVIFYEPVASEIRHIQRKGRTGRRSKGKVIILASKDSVDMHLLYASKRRMEKMRNIFNTKKTSLKPMKRSQISSTPLTEKELESLEELLEKEKANLGTEDYDFKLQNYKLLAKMKENKFDDKYLYNKQSRFDGTINPKNKSKNNNKLIDKTIRNIYELLVREKINKKTQFDLRYLSDHFSIDYKILLDAIDQLQKEQIITVKNNSIIFDKIPNSKEQKYMIYVEKILPGKASVLVNGRWHAVLNYYDYDGPRNILKKGSEFMARADLYNNEGSFCIRIKEVIL